MVINFTEATYRPSVFFFLLLKLYISFTSFRNPCLLRIPIYISLFFVSELRRFSLHTFPCVHFFDVFIFILFQFNAVLCSTLYSAPSNQHHSPSTIFYLPILQIFFIFKYCFRQPNCRLWHCYWRYYSLKHHHYFFHCYSLI